MSIAVNAHELRKAEAFYKRWWPDVLSTVSRRRETGGSRVFKGVVEFLSGINALTRR